MTAKQAWYLVRDHWWVGALALVLILVGWYLFFGGKSGTDELEDQISGQKGVNAVIVNQIANQEGVVNNAETIANQANGNLANSIRRDSNTFSGNWLDADNAFCSRFPDDSSCREWRLRNGR